MTENENQKTQMAMVVRKTLGLERESPPQPPWDIQVAHADSAHSQTPLHSQSQTACDLFDGHSTESLHHRRRNFLHTRFAFGAHQRRFVSGTRLPEIIGAERKKFVVNRGVNERVECV